MVGGEETIMRDAVFSAGHEIATACAGPARADRAHGSGTATAGQQRMEKQSFQGQADMAAHRLAMQKCQ